jgi:hypothetical protein
MLCIAKVDERVQARHRLEHDVPTLAAVAAVGPAIFDVLLPPKTHRPRPAGAGADINLGLIEEMHGVKATVARGLRQVQAEQVA